MSWKTEYKTGTDCSGNDGETDRVLTLANTETTTDNGFLVYADGLALSQTTQFTVTHNNSSSYVTFLGMLWDDMKIVVNYNQGVDTSSSQTAYGDARDDFQAIVNANGISATLKRETTTQDTMGGVSAVSTESYTIKLMIQDISNKDRKIHEMGLAKIGNSKAFFYHLYPDAITGNGDITVEVGDIIELGNGDQFRIENMLGERYMASTEIFRTGIIRRINLD